MLCRHAAQDEGSSKRKANDAANPQAPRQKKKIQDPVRARASQLYSEIAQNAKHNRLASAMDSFQSAVNEGIALNSGLLNTLLYLAVGGSDWEVYARTGTGPSTPSTSAPDGDRQEKEVGTLPSEHPQETDPSTSQPPLPPPEKETLVSFANTLWSHMQETGAKPDNGTFLALARLSAIMGDSAASLEWAHRCHELGHQVSLRLYHPAIVSLIVKGKVMGDRAVEIASSVESIDKEISAQGKEHLDLTEQEYALMLEAFASYGSWPQVASESWRHPLPV
jgi:hypothetical protein